MAHLKDLIVLGSMKVLGKILGKMGGKLTICGKEYDGSKDVTI